MVVLYPEMESLQRSNAEILSKKRYAENIARDYQMEFLNKAKEGNIIVCLETGSGKTLIAVLLLEHLAYSFAPLDPAIAIFLVPTVNLVQQQGSVIETHSDVRVGRYSSQSDGGSFDLQKWEEDILHFEVLVMTPQILLNALRHALIQMATIKLLIFDECHHCQKGHPYCRIMEEYYFGADVPARPKIFGMTASPIIRKGKSEAQYRHYIDSLERMLDAKIVPLKDRSKLEAMIRSPEIQIEEFLPNYGLYDKLQLHMQALHGLKDKHCRDATASFDEYSKYTKKQIMGFGKVCRDLEYCMYDLGLWFARHAARSIFASKGSEGPEESFGRRRSKATGPFMEDICKLFDNHIPEGNDGIEAGRPRPDLVSDKVSTLVNVLSKFGGAHMKGIVFVERVIAAKVLASYLSHKMDFIRCEFIIGSQAKTGSQLKIGRAMARTLEEFRSGKVNLLVATNVAEEGIDIQACHLVVQFDIPKTLRSFIQSRGRARAPGSHYIVLKERGNIVDEERLASLFESESLMKEHISQHEAAAEDPDERGDIQGGTDSFQVKGTGATVNLLYSVQLLHYFCSKLPKDQHSQPQPEFRYLSEVDGVRCEVLLPSPSPIRRVLGEVCELRSAAKKAACLEACKLLHSKGVLTDFLLPVAPVGSKDGCRKHHAPEKTETSAGSNVVLQETIVPSLLSGERKAESGVVSLRGYTILFDPVPMDREYTNFTLLLQSALPSNAETLCLDLCMSHGKTIRCEVVPCGEVSLDQTEVTKCELFQSRLFSVLLDRDLKLPSQSQLTEWFTIHSSWYLLLPLLKTKNGSTHSWCEIDWKTIDKVTSIEDVIDATSMSNSTRSSSPGSLQFVHGLVDAEDVCGSLVRTIVGNNLYCIIDIFKDLNSNSAFPSCPYKNYVEYFKEVHKHELVHREQPLLKAKPLRQAHNLLQVRFNKRKGSTSTEQMLVELPPEVCCIEVFGLHDALINAAAVLPSFMHRLESMLIANQLRNVFGNLFPQGLAVTTEKVLEALTTQKCVESFSLERLELLGDSFLKYVISSHLFLAYDTDGEGVLSFQRNLRVCNASLYSLGTALGIPDYILDGLFRPEHWVAPCHCSKVLCSEAEILKPQGESDIMCNKRHRWMQKKTVADSMEALIGAYLVDGGHDVAILFMRAAGFEISIDPTLILRVQSSSKHSLLSSIKFDIEGLENSISYTFKHRGLLVEAFTHASCRQSRGRCYQRLEFLGDSVLDYLITRYLYKEFTKLTPGDLTDLRSAVVNNESFARVAIQSKLYDYLLCDSPELLNSIDKFIQYVQNASNFELLGDWEGEKGPKILGDIVESLAGAIFVDGGFDLETVWTVFQPILEPIVSIKTTQLHPVRKLLELSQKHRFDLQHEVLLGETCKFMYHVHTSGIEVTGLGQANDKKSAKRQAAFSTLNQLEALGIVYKFKSPFRRKLKADSQIEQAQDCVTKDRDTVDSEDSLTIRSTAATNPACDSKDVTCDPCDFYMAVDVHDGRVAMDSMTGSFAKDKEQESNVSSKCQMEFLDCALYDSESFNESGYLLKGAKKEGTHDCSLQTLDEKLVTLSIKVCTGGETCDENLHWRNGPGGLVYANQRVCRGEEGHSGAPLHSLSSDLSSEDTSLSCLGHRAHNSHVPSAQVPSAIPSSTNVRCRSDEDGGECTKGQARVMLYEICAKKRWRLPEFVCCNEDGAPHDRMYTYDAVLHIPSVGKVACYGDPRRSKKAAMDSAAEELLNWLRAEGKV